VQWDPGSRKLVGGIGTRPGQGIEQRRLAGVGIPHQSHRRHRAALAQGAPLGTLPTHPGQAAFQLIDSGAQEAAIAFELGFTRAAQANTPFLALQMGPAAHQASRQMAQLGQFHLQLALEGTRTLGKNVEDEPGPVQHPTLDQRLQIALLAGRQGMIDQHQTGARLLHHGPDFLGLAGADEIFRLRAGAMPPHARNYLGTGRAGQLLEFGMGGSIARANVQAHQHATGIDYGAFEHERPL